MKKWILSIGLLGSTVGFAQITQRNLLTNRYSLQDIKQSIVPINAFHPFPTTAEAWHKALPDSTLSSLVNDGVTNQSKPFGAVPIATMLDFMRKGNRSNYENASFNKRTRLIQLTIAESIEGKGRFMDAIIDGVWSICEESFWGVPAHITATQGIPEVSQPVVELFSAETATTLALVNYFVGDKLDAVSPLFRKRMIAEINSRFFKPLAENIETYAYLKKENKVNNWNPWIMSNYITTILLIEKDNSKRSEMLYNAMRGVERYFNGLGDDGGCDEGAHYWNAAGASAFDCLEWLKMGTNNKVDIFSDPLITKMLLYIVKVHIGGTYFVNVGDGEPTIDHLNGAFLYRIGTTVHDEQIKQFGLWVNKTFTHSHGIDSFSKMRSIENILTIPTLPATTTAYQSPQYAWINDVQLMTARTARNGLFLATHAGHNGESHNHNDVGDFIIYVNDEPFIIDAGRSTYTAKTFSAHRYELWNMQSQYHNLPTINGLGQSAGKEFGASDVVNTHTATEDKLTMNIIAAYPKEAGIVSWKRTNSLLQQKELIQVQDEYQLEKAPSNLQQSFLTVAKVDTSTAGKIILIGEKDKLILSYSASQFNVSLDTPTIEGTEYGRIGKGWNNRTITRVLLSAKKPKAKDKLVYQFKKG